MRAGRGLLAAMAAATALGGAGGAAAGPGAAEIRYHAPAADPAAEQVRALLPKAKAKVEAFFGAPFAEPLNVTLAPDRASFNAAFPKAWGMDKTECWMVGVGVAEFLVVLSPADWQQEACEHDAGDRAEVADAAEAIAKGQAPTQLAKAWSGRYRYGVCGSLVRYVDQTWGRKTVIALLPATTQGEILGKLGVSEAELLRRWKTWAAAGR